MPFLTHRDAVSDARAKEARQLAQLGQRLRGDLRDDPHRRERGNGVVGAGWRLELHVVGIVDEIVIWDKFVINGLTFLVYNRVGVYSCRRLGSCQR